MLIHDWKRFHENVEFNWFVDKGEDNWLVQFIAKDSRDEFFELFGLEDGEYE